MHRDRNLELAMGHPLLVRRQELELAHKKLPGKWRSLLGLWARAALARTRPSEHHDLPPVGPGELGITFIGDRTVLLRSAGMRIVTDPNWESHLFGLRRAHAPGLRPDEVGPVDLVLLSGAQYDHLVRASLRRISEGAVCVVPARCADLIANLGFRQIVELEAGESFAEGSVHIQAVAACQPGGRRLGLRARGSAGYIVRAGGPSVYFGGSTAYFSGFADFGQRYRPDIALLPIGRYSPAGFRKFNMSPLDCLYALEDLGARTLIPIAFGSFRLSYEPIDEPSNWLAELARARSVSDRVVILQHGETFVTKAPGA